jgi:hypothetical protein
MTRGPPRAGIPPRAPGRTQHIFLSVALAKIAWIQTKKRAPFAKARPYRYFGDENPLEITTKKEQGNT